jgi:hypothetical protein
VDFTSNCQDTSGQLRQPLRGHSSVLREMFPGNCSDTARKLPGKHPDDSSDASPDATRVVAWRAALFFNKGMVSSKNQGFQVSESRQKSCSAERIKIGALM